MKIGILTFHRALNYGAVLQCYALKEVLCELGHDVEIIDYRPSCIEKHRKLLSGKDFKKLNFYNKIKNICYLPWMFFYKNKANNVFDAFLNKYFNISKPIFEKNQIPSIYDYIFFGSDQIWSHRICGGFEDVYWGQFEKKNTKFITYAASMEDYNELSDSSWTLINKYLYSFDAISVREKSLCDVLIKKTSHRIYNVLDPTLLCSPLVLDKFCQSNAIKKKYVLLFSVQGESFTKEIAKYISEKYNYTIVRVVALRYPRKKKDINTIYIDSCRPEEFVNLIYNSEFVITNSFHATAISIQLQKNFIVAKCKNPNRVHNLLSALGLQKRYIADTKAVDYLEDVNYDEAFRKLQILRDSSLNYIQNCLGKSIN